MNGVVGSWFGEIRARGVRYWKLWWPDLQEKSEQNGEKSQRKSREVRRVGGRGAGDPTRARTRQTRPRVSCGFLWCEIEFADGHMEETWACRLTL